VYNWLLRLFGDSSKKSCEVKEFLAKEGETSASIHEYLVGFDLIHRP
jgi:hypothetical protein